MVSAVRNEKGKDGELKLMVWNSYKIRALGFTGSCLNGQLKLMSTV